MVQHLEEGLAGEILNLVLARFELSTGKNGHWVVGCVDQHGYREQGDTPTQNGLRAFMYACPATHSSVSAGPSPG